MPSQRAGNRRRVTDFPTVPGVRRIVVLRANGERVKDGSDLTRRVASARAGQTVRLEVYRNGQTRTVNVTSGTRPTQ